MEGYKPPYKLTEDMMFLVASISEKLGKIDVYHNLDAKPHLHSRETFRKNYMDPALRLGLIVRTIPDKPNSRNQRYVKK